MLPLPLHDLHHRLGARFTQVNGSEVVASYGQTQAEHQALLQSAAVLDLSFRSRLCLTGGDRIRFLHGQVTNDIRALGFGQGCYAALVSAKGRMESDLNVYCLEEELLLDFEPGLAEPVSRRLEKFLVADDVQVADVAPLFGLLSVQGPLAEAVVRKLALFTEIPGAVFEFRRQEDPQLGELYLVFRPRLHSNGFDLFAPKAALEPLAARLLTSAREVGGGLAGWEALEIARVEAGIPRYGQDMDERNFPQECGIEERALSYTKGCYIGQEVLNRIHTMGHVNRMLSGVRFADPAAPLPSKDDKFWCQDKEAGYLTSVCWSPTLQAVIALGYLRNEARQPGTELIVRTAAGRTSASVETLPFKR